MTRAAVYPELVGGREDGVETGPWVVHEGTVQRGGASCNVSERILEVPLDRGEQARVVRAHELMHARVSPAPRHLARALSEVETRALECAEELRVNELLSRLGFSTSLLSDGTEKPGGRRLSDNECWSECVCFMVAVLGTGGERPFLSGIRQSKPSWMAALRVVRKSVLSITEGVSTTDLARTDLDEDDLPVGYARTTLPVARVLTRAMAATVPQGPGEGRSFRRALEPGGRRPATGRFAPLVFDDSKVKVSQARRGGVRRPQATTTGVTLRYPGRLLTDDLRRAFVGSTRRRGGVVLIDQSGSMELDPVRLSRLVRLVPGAVVLGYSHRPGDLGGTPNVWLLAEGGRIAATMPSGNVGNGVDAPALRLALALRRGAEPVVWVTDGQVTDANDHPCEELSRECARLVRRYRIRLAGDLADAARELRSRRVALPSSYGRFGRVGQELRRKP